MWNVDKCNNLTKNNIWILFRSDMYAKPHSYSRGTPWGSADHRLRTTALGDRNNSVFVFTICQNSVNMFRCYVYTWRKISSVYIRIFVHLFNVKRTGFHNSCTNNIGNPMNLTYGCETVLTSLRHFYYSNMHIIHVYSIHRVYFWLAAVAGTLSGPYTGAGGFEPPIS